MPGSMAHTNNYTEDTLVQQTTADYLEQQLDSEPVYVCNNENFGTDRLSGSGTARRLYE